MKMKSLDLVIVLLLVAVVHCGMATVSTPVAAEKPPSTSTLTDLSWTALKMVEAMSSDSDSKEVDLEGLGNLVTSLTRSSVFVDNPQVMRDYDLNNRLTELEDKMEAELTKLRKQNEEQQKALSVITKGTDFIGFSATLTKSLSVVSGSAVKYDNIIFNKGLQYDPAFGFLTCPQKGYYYVCLSYRRNSGTAGEFGLRVKVGSQVASLQVYDYYNSSSYNVRSGSNSSSFSGSGVIYCGVGERMYVEATSSGKLIGGGSYTTISMYLLKGGEM